MHVIPWWKLNAVLSEKDLNPANSIRSIRIMNNIPYTACTDKSILSRFKITSAGRNKPDEWRFATRQFIE
jgi:hypothetical protein